MWNSKGMVRINRVMPKMIAYQHIDKTGVVTNHLKRLRPTRNVLEFDIGDCGVRYGGCGLTFASDDSRWSVFANNNS